MNRTISVSVTAFDGTNIEGGSEGNDRIPIPLSHIIVFSYNSPKCDPRPINDADHITIVPPSACSTTTDWVYTATLVLSSTTHVVLSKTLAFIKAQVNADAEENNKKRGQNHLR